MTSYCCHRSLNKVLAEALVREPDEIDAVSVTHSSALHAGIQAHTISDVYIAELAKERGLVLLVDAPPFRANFISVLEEWAASRACILMRHPELLKVHWKDQRNFLRNSRKEMEYFARNWPESLGMICPDAVGGKIAKLSENGILDDRLPITQRLKRAIKDSMWD